MLQHIMLCYITSYYIMIYHSVLYYVYVILYVRNGEPRDVGSARKGANGVGTSGVTANFSFLTDFWGTPVNLLLYSQKRQGIPLSPICQN